MSRRRGDQLPLWPIAAAAAIAAGFFALATALRVVDDARVELD